MSTTSFYRIINPVTFWL